MVVASALASVCFRVPFVLHSDVRIDCRHPTCNVFCWTHAAALQRARHRQADRKSLCDKVGVLDKFISLVFFALLLPDVGSTNGKHRLFEGELGANCLGIRPSLQVPVWVLKSECQIGSAQTLASQGLATHGNLVIENAICCFPAKEAIRCVIQDHSGTWT